MDNYELAIIENLPDIIPSEVIVKQFEKLLPQLENLAPTKDLLLLKAFFELADRQWHTYQRLPDKQFNKIDATLINLWDKNSLESTETLLGIIACLGLAKTFEQVCSALEDSELLTDIRWEILEAIEEFGTDVADPYSGLS